jgi:nucleolar protein 58
MQTRENAADTDFEGILEEEVAADLKEIATISMGTEISTEDMSNITALCDQVGNAAVDTASCDICLSSHLPQTEPASRAALLGASALH